MALPGVEDDARLAVLVGDGEVLCRFYLQWSVFVTGVALADSAVIVVGCTTTRPKAYPMGKPVFKLYYTRYTYTIVTFIAGLYWYCIGILYRTSTAVQLYCTGTGIDVLVP